MVETRYPRLRGAEPKDADFVFGVLDEAVGPHLREIDSWNEAEQRRIVAYLFETADVYVIQVSGMDVGYLAVWRSADELYVASIALTKHWQRRGIGTALMADLITEAGPLPIRLNVMSNNPAREFYERLGFTVTGEEGRKLRMERQV